MPDADNAGMDLEELTAWIAADPERVLAGISFPVTVPVRDGNGDLIPGAEAVVHRTPEGLTTVITMPAAAASYGYPPAAMPVRVEPGHVYQHPSGD